MRYLSASPALPPLPSWLPCYSLLIAPSILGFLSSLQTHVSFSPSLRLWLPLSLPLPAVERLDTALFPTQKKAHTQSTPLFKPLLIWVPGLQLNALLLFPPSSVLPPLPRPLSNSLTDIFLPCLGLVQWSTNTLWLALQNDTSPKGLSHASPPAFTTPPPQHPLMPFFPLLIQIPKCSPLPPLVREANTWAEIRL